MTAPQSLAGSGVGTIPSPPCTCQSEDNGRNKMLNERLPWLRLLASTAGGTGSILGRGTKVPHVSAKNQKAPNGPLVLPPRAPRPPPCPIRSVATPSLFPGVGNMAAFPPAQCQAQALAAERLGWLISELLLLLSLPRVFSEA